MSAIFFAFRKFGFAFCIDCMGNSRNLFLPFIDDINSGSSQCACYQILPVEGFAQTETGGDGSYYGDERIVYRYLSYGIAAQ